MARPDKVYSRFRGVVAADLTGTWGDNAAPDLICVKSDSNGLLVAAGVGDAEGVIWTPEGKSGPDVANYNVALAGSVMTVFVCAEFVGTFDEGTESLTAGEGVWSAASGGITDTAPAAAIQKIGRMFASDEGGPRLFLNVGFGQSDTDT